MRRIRFLVALLAVALALPTALLVWRGLEGVAAEKAVRHRAVAERVFDEMERSLSRFLETEENRAWDDYRRERIGSEQPAFVVGHFEQGADGRVQVPGAAGLGEAARRVEGVVALDRAARGSEAEVAAAAVEAGAGLGEQAPGTTAVTLAPGGRDQLRALGYVAEEPAASVMGQDTEGEAQEQRQGRAYDALQSLNRGASERKERARKVVEEAPAEVYADARREASASRLGRTLAGQKAATPTATAKTAPPSAHAGSPSTAPLARSRQRAKDEAAPRAPALADADRAGLENRPSEAFESLAEGVAQRVAGDPEAAGSGPSASEGYRAGTEADAAEADDALAIDLSPLRREIRPAAPRGRPPEAAPRAKRTAAESLESHDGREGALATVRIAVDPLHGRAVGDEHLLLARTVWIGQRGVRQGLVLDRAALAEWLRSRVFAPLALPGAELSFQGAEPRGTYGFRHRFAEPFQDVTAGLSLAPLAGGRGAMPIYLLAGLLALVGTAGLLAVYRSAAVTVGFAERRSNFVAAVTHELKTPLTSIRMYAEMLRDGIVADDAKRDEYYRTITAESERLGRLINNVLEFSRLEKGTREMALEAGDLGLVVAEAAEVLRPHAEAERFSLEVEIEPDLPAVRFDRDAVFQVVFNLIDNAIKYAAEGRERRVRVSCRAAAGGHVELCVRDHGPGVPARQLARVFEPFYRGEDELTRRQKGTGLGLALVQSLSAGMNARLEATSPDTGGLQIQITF